jgi:hypothetical protein
VGGFTTLNSNLDRFYDCPLISMHSVFFKRFFWVALRSTFSVEALRFLEIDQDLIPLTGNVMK